MISLGSSVGSATASTPGLTCDRLPTGVVAKIFVQVDCASHQLLVEGCAGDRCRPAAGTPYGGAAGAPWSGPHSTVTTALSEWITSGTFNGAQQGRFIVDASGVARAAP